MTLCLPIRASRWLNADTMFTKYRHANAIMHTGRGLTFNLISLPGFPNTHTPTFIRTLKKRLKHNDWWWIIETNTTNVKWMNSYSITMVVTTYTASLRKAFLMERRRGAVQTHRPPTHPPREGITWPGSASCNTLTSDQGRPGGPQAGMIPRSMKQGFWRPLSNDDLRSGRGHKQDEPIYWPCCQELSRSHHEERRDSGWHRVKPWGTLLLYITLNNHHHHNHNHPLELWPPNITEITTETRQATL